MERIHAGDCLKKVQSRLGVSSADLARATGTTRQQVLRWRLNSNMKLHTIELICKALDLHIYEFIYPDLYDLISDLSGIDA